MITPRVLVFDVNETLSDLSPLRSRFTDVGLSGSMASLWFTSVLRDGFALNLWGQIRPFAEIGAELLASMLDPTTLDRSVEEAVSHVLEGFMALPVHSDVVNGIASLYTDGFRLVTLSNGAPVVAEQLLTRAEVRDSFTAVLSVEGTGTWKPAASAYAYAAQQCDTDLAEMMMVAVHPWDLHGAMSAGMSGAWLNRSGGTYPAYFTPPDIEITRLEELSLRLV